MIANRELRTVGRNPKTNEMRTKIKLKRCCKMVEMEMEIGWRGKGSDRMRKQKTTTLTTMTTTLSDHQWQQAAQVHRTDTYVRIWALKKIVCNMCLVLKNKIMCVCYVCIIILYYKQLI